MTKEEIFKIKEHIEIHARREPYAIKITEIMWKAVVELEHLAELEQENAELKADLNEKENTVHTLDVLHKEAVRKYGEVNERLTKAKELLAKWVELYKTKVDTFLPTPIQVDTEQFLKSEVEK